MRTGLVRVWSTAWSGVLLIVFLPTTALTVSVWAADPGQASTHPTGDVAFLALGAMIAAGLVAQSPHPGSGVAVAGAYQAVLAAAALGAAGAIGARVEPLVGGLVLLAVTVIALILHTPRRQLQPAGGRADGVLLAIAGLAVVPALVLAALCLARARAAGPSCFLGACARGDRYAEFAAMLVAVCLVAFLAAVRLPGWRLPAWSAGVVAVLVGSAWLAIPPPGQGRIPVGVVLLVWGAVWLAAAMRPAARVTPGIAHRREGGADDRC